MAYLAGDQIFSLVKHSKVRVVIQEWLSSGVFRCKGGKRIRSTQLMVGQVPMACGKWREHRKLMSPEKG